MSMFCVMGDHEICEALGAQSIVHFSADPDAPSMVPCKCPCHGCRHDGETYRTDYTNARKLTRVTKCAQCDETIGVDEYRLTSAVHRIPVNSS